jgi:hypothetical protein
MNKLKTALSTKRILLEAVFIFLLGSAMHFAYGWSGENSLVQFVAPINESIWEHTKLFILPILLVSYFRFKSTEDLRITLSLALVQFLFMATFIVSFFYTYTEAFGVEEILWVDIVSFGIASYLGVLINYSALKLKVIPAWLSGGTLILLFAFYCYATLYPFAIPLFESH